MKNQFVMKNKIGIIYAGGTFGSYGKPLQSLEPKVFLPILTEILHRHFQEDYLYPLGWQILSNDVVKDSSQLSPADFAHFYQLILTARQAGCRQFVLLTGTDTLSYLSAFLAEAFVGSDLCIAVTGAMQPLLDANNIEKFVIDPETDASLNLFCACQTAVEGNSGVWVCFDSIHMAHTVSKLYSHDFTAERAFAGYLQPDPDYPQSHYLEKTNKQWIKAHEKNLQTTLQRLKNANIIPLYLMPISAEQLAYQVLSALASKPSALIFLGFGAGNLPKSEAVEQALKQAYQQNCLVIITTQCPFGGVSDSYQAGAWLADCGVMTSGILTLSTIYARLLWLSTKDADIQSRQNFWQNCLENTVE